jgi:uncharacterized membrane protein (GlpM family)
MNEVMLKYQVVSELVDYIAGILELSPSFYILAHDVLGDSIEDMDINEIIYAYLLF